MALGSYPTVTLEQARSARGEAREFHANGKDPVTARQEARLTERTISAATFEMVSRDFHATQSPEWSEAHAARWPQCRFCSGFRGLLRACSKWKDPGGARHDVATGLVAAAACGSHAPARGLNGCARLATVRLLAQTELLAQLLRA